MRIEVERLEHEADVLSDAVQVDTTRHDLGAVDPDPSVARLLEAVDASQEGALARPGRPDEDDHLTRPHPEVDALQDFEVTERLVEVIDLEQEAVVGHRVARGALNCTSACAASGRDP